MDVQRQLDLLELSLGRTLACDLRSAALSARTCLVIKHNAGGRSSFVARPPAFMPSISISNANDRKGFIADSAGSFAARRIGKREFLRRLGLAGVGLSSFAATMLGGNRRFRAVAAPQALVQ